MEWLIIYWVATVSALLILRWRLRRSLDEFHEEIRNAFQEMRDDLRKQREEREKEE